ncbi:MAG: hypothetical protein L0191_09050 [Acidobacteria bacterium]|nr:hypothetical protein [Acidobacteriota bacterium]
MGKHHLPFKLGALMTLGLLILAPLTAEAAEGEIKGVTVTPNPASVNSTVTIQIQGKDTCSVLIVNFGDGQIPLTNVTLPHSIAHAYKTAGTFTVTAAGVANCKGTESATLVVQSPLAQLCATINCLTAFSAPRIDQVVPFISEITPGGYVAIKGSGFGEAEGELYLTGLKSWSGLSLAPVKLTIPKEQGKDFWKPTSVLGLFPDNITQVKDQPAKLQIKTATNKWSNEYPVNFIARKPLVLLPSTDPAVKIVSCSTDASDDACNNWIDPDSVWLAGWNCSATETFCGNHFNCTYCGTDTGTDTFQITLKNGWVIEAMSFSKDVTAPGEASASGPSNVPNGATVWQPSVNWSVTGNDGVTYGAAVFITGPAGVPWK